MMGSSSSSSAVGVVGLGGSAAQPSWWNPPRRRRLSVSPSLRLSSLLQSSFKYFSKLNRQNAVSLLAGNVEAAKNPWKDELLELSLFYHVPRLKDLWCEKASQFKEINLQFSNDIFSPACSSCLFFFNGGETRMGAGDEGTPHLSTPRRNAFKGRQWTNILLAVNILIYVAQLGTQGKLLMWGAKINSLIDKGQVWRLATSAFLHANIGHLLVNCYSLNSIGPTIEALCGPRRFLSVYFASAIASSAASYWFCKGSAVGASGAIFGLVGSLAVFILRHQGMIRGGKEELQHIAQVIFLNMMFGLLYKGIDNWGHLGGLVGGVAIAWLVGPAWKSELSSKGRIFVDRAPIRYLTGRKPEPRDLN